ncbi:chorismate mutase [Zooshikella harenae]|uniref:chorismate mutase n=1 Tax=Zooshikella harenae TaxID=2827238 RepID=A0ABS5ZCM3_9GAMM|nr:chorismate mutase [Zooshikella harenae]MBU2711715.1 chorismate mutase [Zooshikella harenae]
MDKTINTLRKEVEKIDIKLVNLLAKRFALTSEIGKCKHYLGLPAVDKSRVEQFLKRWKNMAKSHQISTECIGEIAQKIHDLVVANHNKHYQLIK